MAGHVARMGKRRGARMVFLGKSKGNKPHGRPRNWEDNIKMNLQ